MLDRRTLLKSFCAGSALALAQVKAGEFRADSELDGNLRIWDQHSHLGSVPGDTPEERIAFLVKHGSSGRGTTHPLPRILRGSAPESP
jgi:hypothetical protein